MVVQLAGRLPMAAHVPNALRAMSDDPNERSQVAAGVALGAMLAFDADMHGKAFSTIIGMKWNLLRIAHFMREYCRQKMRRGGTKRSCGRTTVAGTI